MRRYVYGALAVATGALLIWWAHLKTTTSAAQRSEIHLQAPQSSVNTQQSPHGIPQPSSGNTLATNSGSSLKYRREIELLLTSSPGRISVLEASNLVNTLKSDSGAALIEINKLTISDNLTERLLGFFLSLEIRGPMQEVLARAARDPSAHIRSEVSAWLYQSAKYEQWDQFVNSISTSLSRNDLADAFLLLDQMPARMDLPAAMALLGLGRGLPQYLEELMRRNSDIVAMARDQLFDPQISPTRKENLLALLDHSNPERYSEILRGIISISEDDRSPRWQAVWNFGQTASDSQSLRFLSDWLDSHPNDLLRNKIQESASAVSNRMQLVRHPVANLEQELKNRVEDQSQPNNETRNLFSHYVYLSMRDRNYTADLELLQKGRTLFFTNTVTDLAFSQARANVDFLIWKTR